MSILCQNNGIDQKSKKWPSQVVIKAPEPPHTDTVCTHLWTKSHPHSGKNQKKGGKNAQWLQWFLTFFFFSVQGGKLEILQYIKVTIQDTGVGRSAKGTLALQSLSNRPSLLKLKFPYRYVEGRNNGSYGNSKKCWFLGRCLCKMDNTLQRLNW